MTPVAALLVAVGEILGVCAIGMGVYGLCRLRLQRRRDVRVAEQTCGYGYGWHAPGCVDAVNASVDRLFGEPVLPADDPVNVAAARELWGEQE